MKISIVAPMFNESANMENTLAAIKTEMAKHPDWDYEMIFVNDGSTDDTWTKGKDLEKKEEQLTVIGYQTHQGRGMALRIGFSEASGNVIATIDFDLSYNPSHITKMVETLRDNPSVDVVLASAFMPGGQTINVPPFRLWISRMANFLCQYAFKQKIYTSTCVVRAYRKKVLDNLTLESTDKVIHLEIISKALDTSYKIKEIPAILSVRKTGKAKFKLVASSISHLKFLFKQKPILVTGILLFMVLFVCLLVMGIIFLFQ